MVRKVYLSKIIHSHSHYKTTVRLKLLRLIRLFNTLWSAYYATCTLRRRVMGVMPLWATATSCTDCAIASVYLHTFPHTFHQFPLFTFLFRTGGHFPAVGDRLRQAPLAENGPGGPFLAGDTYLRDRPVASFIDCSTYTDTVIIMHMSISKQVTSFHSMTLWHTLNPSQLAS